MNLHRPLHRFLPLVLLLLSMNVGGARAETLRAGAAAVNITPPLGIEINGGTAPALATYVHDELQAKAIVLDDGRTRLAFVVVDNCLIDRALLDEAKALIHRHTGLGSNQVCISTTHTHSAGSVTGAHLSEPDPAYRAWLPARLSDAVRIAIHHLAPATIGWGSVSVPQHVFNRRIRVQPGVVYTNLLGQSGDQAKMNWSSPEPGVDGTFSGPVDPEVFVVSVRHADGRPLGLLANYSLHYVGGVGPGHLSADYFGEFACQMGERLGATQQDPPFVALLSNGTSGDINNIDYRQSRPAQAPYEQIRRVATDVADAVEQVLKQVKPQSSPTLSAAATNLVLRVRKPTPTELERARAIVGGRDRSALRTWTEIYAREQLLLAQYPDELSLPLQVFRVGDLVVAQWPGEIFAVTGLDLKARSLVKPLFNIGLANGWFGYLPPPEQHALGAYETWRGRTSPMETNAIPRITDTFLRLIESTSKRQ
jgi:hypothetical protein